MDAMVLFIKLKCPCPTCKLLISNLWYLVYVYMPCIRSCYQNSPTIFMKRTFYIKVIAQKTVEHTHKYVLTHQDRQFDTTNSCKLWPIYKIKHVPWKKGLLGKLWWKWLHLNNEIANRSIVLLNVIKQSITLAEQTKLWDSFSILPK